MALIDPGPALDSHTLALQQTLGADEQIVLILITHPHADHSDLAATLQDKTGAAMPGLRDGDRFMGSWGTLQALHTPGHHPQHFCFLGRDYALTGDHVMGWSSTLVAPPEGRMSDYMASLDRLEAAGAATGLPGHGEIIGDLPDRIRALRHHRQQREAAILAAVQAGQDNLTAITQAAYGQISPALMQAAKASCLSHLIDLAERKLIQARPDLTRPAIFVPN